MEKYKYDLVVFVGRCEPNHIGHNRNINEGLKLAKNVLVILGSANKPRSIENPFTVPERAAMIKNVFPTNNVTVRAVQDFDYQTPLWNEVVHSCVKQHILDADIIYNVKPSHDDFRDPAKAKIAILGHDKDSTSSYLRDFPTWDFVEIGAYAEHDGHPIDATKIRELYFEGHHSYLKGALHDTTYDFLMKFTKQPEYNYLVKEYKFIKNYKKPYLELRYPVTFHTVDSVVVQGTHVLLIKRGATPGKDLWALPGGFLNQTETCKEAAVRELMEETKIRLPEVVLRKSIVWEQLFDKPNRSMRGRTLTMAYLFQLTEGGGKLPKVVGSDDASEARWFSLDTVADMSSVMFEDHYSIIQLMKNRLKSDR